jgi:ubiquinone/menaquinone biosynthesis C-methylase UbiE
MVEYWLGASARQIGIDRGISELFSKVWNRQPNECEDGLWLFGREEDGDYFDDEDALRWQNGRFEQSWFTDKLLNNAASRKLIDEIVGNRKPYVDLACGPGMGLIPSIRKISSELPCLAVDANSMLMKEWRKWLNRNGMQTGIEFAQFSLFDVPVKDHAVNAYGGFLSLSSTRSGSKGYDAALAEIYRTLAPRGRLYVIESEWVDVPAILKVFERSCLQPWNCFLEPQLTWHDRFLQSGFRILSEELYMNRSLNSEDNELGREAEKAGIRIGMQWNAYILEKPLSAR